MAITSVAQSDYNVLSANSSDGMIHTSHIIEREQRESDVKEAIRTYLIPTA
jgi:hypothetical protein